MATVITILNMAFRVTEENLSKMCYIQVREMLYLLAAHQLSRLSVSIANRTQSRDAHTC